MLKRVLKSLAVVSVLCVSGGVVSASTVSLRYDGPTAEDYATVKFKAAPVKPAGSHAGAVGFNMSSLSSSGKVIDEFVAWCLDIQHWLAPKNEARSYTVTSTPFTTSYALGTTERARVQSVFDANYKTLNVADKYQAAGFQVALWNALYDSDWLAGSGAFKVKSEIDVITSANAYLKAASNYKGTRHFNLTYLQSNTENQSLVTATPVPVPAAAGLLLLALGGLAAVGGRRRTV